MHFCGDVQQVTAFPRRLGNRRAFPDFPVSERTESSETVYLFNSPSHHISVLGTPKEDTWKGVSQLPDYKDSFPMWSAQNLANVVRNLDEKGVDLLQVGYAATLHHVVFPSDVAIFRKCSLTTPR